MNVPKGIGPGEQAGGHSGDCRWPVRHAGPRTSGRLSRTIRRQTQPQTRLEFRESRERENATIATARATAETFARLAKADNTRRAYRAGVAAWCAWCARHALPCLPATAADVVAFLAAERQRGLKVATIDLRRAAIRYLHYLAGGPVPTAEAVVGETLAGIRRDAAQRGEFPAKKLAAAVGVLREI